MQIHKNPGKQLIQAVALVSTSEYSSQLVTLSRGPLPWAREDSHLSLRCRRSLQPQGAQASAGSGEMTGKAE